MNPAPVLRIAAGLMLDRARRASPGPWDVAASGELCWVVSESDSTPVTMECGEAGIAADPYNSRGGANDAEHIASWSPPVAIAVANWLLEEADLAQSMGSNYVAWLHTTRGHGALTVATEYLRITKYVMNNLDHKINLPLNQPGSWN